MSVPAGASAVIVWYADAAMTMQRDPTTTRLSMSGRDSRRRERACLPSGRLVRAEQENSRALAFGAHDLESSSDAGRALAHPDQAVSAALGLSEAASLVRDLDEKGVSGVMHADPADGRTRVF